MEHSRKEGVGRNKPPQSLPLLPNTRDGGGGAIDGVA